MDLDKPFPSFEHAQLGPLPRDPKLIKLTEEVEKWKKKYSEIYHEQCKTTSLETSLREKLRSAELERDKFKAMVDAQRDIIQWVLDLKAIDTSK